MFDTDFLQKVLETQSYITSDDAKKAIAHEKAGRGSFVDYLIEHDLVNRSIIGTAVAEYYDTTYVDLDGRSPDTLVMDAVTKEMAESLRTVVVADTEKEVTVATDRMDDAQNIQTQLSTIFPKKTIRLVYSFPESLEKALLFYETPLSTRFSEIIKKEHGVAPQLFNEILADALLYRASDIHFEPKQEQTNIRFRIDGVLRLAGALPTTLYTNVLNRIKLEASLRIDEHTAPQDGAIRFMYEGKVVDLRVSVVPIVDGEKIVIRVLAEYIRDLTFSELGFSEEHIHTFERVLAKPFGMIIVTGPTGSGKTTTLYSFIKKVSRPEINITTIEDPVEYYMPYTNQIQVNKETGVTFAKGLRSIVRQDPDVILLGEIRDSETAETAVNASLTGHLLLSTFHANSAAAAVPRLLDMDVEPFLLASTLEMLVAQRLVRRVCSSCRQSESVTVASLEKQTPGISAYIGTQKKVTLYKGAGCAACNHTGYNGRVAVVEAIEIDQSMRELIAQSPSAATVWKEAQRRGVESMFEDGLRKAQLGLTTIEEVLRVTEIPE